MTCIVGLVDGKGSVLIGGDSAGVAGLSVRLRRDVKVFRVGDEMVVGMCGSFRMGQLLRYNLTPPAHPEGEDPHSYMVRLFVDAARQTFKEGGFSKLEDGVEEMPHSAFLIGYRGRLFEIDEDYQVGEVYDGYASVGCGEEFALGVLYATQKSGRTMLWRARQALECASHFSGGVRPPFVFEGLKPRA